LPFNFARIAAIDFPYALCLFLFFLAWSVIDRSRVFAALLFLVSFNTPSLLVFFVLPMADLMYRIFRPWTPKTLVVFPLQRPELFTIPFIFYFIKYKYFEPTGFYEGYNLNLQFLNLTQAIKLQYQDLVSIEVNFIVFFALLALIYFVIQKKKYISTIISLHQFSIFFLIGIFAFILGSFPYWILGLAPTFNEWSSRHQLLLPLGTALVITALLLSCPRFIKFVALSTVVSLSLSLGIINYYNFAVDWNKQKAIIQMFSESEDIRKADVVLITDETTNLNAIKRQYRFYEWNGLLEKAFGDQTRFAVYSDNIGWYKLNHKDVKSLSSEMYKAGSHEVKDSPKVVRVTIKQSSIDPHCVKIFTSWCARLAISSKVIESSQ
jgi:hypothetical protein